MSKNYNLEKLQTYQIFDANSFCFHHSLIYDKELQLGSCKLTTVENYVALFHMIICSALKIPYPVMMFPRAPSE